MTIVIMLRSSGGLRVVIVKCIYAYGRFDRGCAERGLMKVFLNFSLLRVCLAESIGSMAGFLFLFAK